jgi:hypothetical protein
MVMKAGARNALENRSRHESALSQTRRTPVFLAGDTIGLGSALRLRAMGASLVECPASLLPDETPSSTSTTTKIFFGRDYQQGLARVST